MTPSPKPYEVWLVRFVFIDDPSRSKTRPAVCLSYDGSKLRAAMVKVTSHAAREGVPGELELADWASAGLLKPSCARCSQVADIPDRSILRRLGVLSEADKVALLLALDEAGACDFGLRL